MWLRLLIPFTLIWPVLALAAEGTALSRYRATWAREMLALLFAIAAYLGVWVALYELAEAVIDSALAGIVVATLLSLIAVPLVLLLGYRIFGLKPVGTAAGTR